MAEDATKNPLITCFILLPVSCMLFFFLVVSGDCEGLPAIVPETPRQWSAGASPQLAMRAGVVAPAVEDSHAFYQFTDEEGVIHLLDNYDRVPLRHREKMVIHRDFPVVGETTEIKIDGNQVFVPVTLSKGSRAVQATLLLDTGASVTTITEELADSLNIQDSSTISGKTIVADGRTIRTRLALLDAVNVGQKKKSSVMVNIMPRTGSKGMDDGLLGMDFLRHFNYQLDFSGKVIRWQ